MAFSEIENFPRSVLKHHYPDVPLYGDFTQLRVQDWIVDADVLVGGTPCQAFSVAGLRQSLSDDRGNLTLEFVRLANAIDDIRLATNRPESIIVWENVLGVLSVKDNAFGCLLAALVGDDTPLVPTGGKWTNAGMVIGPARAAAWRILDAQYFGVAQRRRRVFVVASARNGFDPAEVLFEREGVRRDTPPSRKTGQRIAESTTQCFDRQSSGEYGTAPVASTMSARDYKSAADLVAQPIAIDYEYNAHNVSQPIGPLLKGSPTGGGHPLPAVMQSMAVAQPDNINGTMQSKPTGGYSLNYMTGVQHDMAVRRLTPRECERLQGFPDDYTLLLGKQADGPRYKALGNSMAVPVMAWIGKRIANHSV